MIATGIERGGRRSPPPILSALVALLGVVLLAVFLLHGREGESAHESTVPASGGEASEGPSADVTGTAPAGREALADEGEPRADRAPEAEEAPEEPEHESVVDAIKLPRVIVRALTLDGAPLQTALSGKGAYLPLGVCASAQPFGPWIPDDAETFAERSCARFVGDDGEASTLGTLLLEADPPLVAALLLGRQVVSLLPLNPGDEELVFRLDVEELRGQLAGLTFQAVLAGSKLPAGRARVLVSWRDPFSFFSLQTDAEGRLTLEPWYPGPGTLTLQTPETGSVELRFELEPGRTKDLGVLVLEPAVRVDGCVLDGAGRPLPEAQLQARSDASPFAAQLAFADSDGAFRLALQPGGWTFEVYGGAAEEAMRPVHREIEPGEDVRLELRLEPAASLVLEAHAFWARRARYRVREPGDATLDIWPSSELRLIGPEKRGEEKKVQTGRYTSLRQPDRFAHRGIRAIQMLQSPSTRRRATSSGTVASRPDACPNPVLRRAPRCSSGTPR